MLERVGTSAFQRTLSGAMKQAQANLADTQLKLATGKKATIYRDMGSAALSTLSARSMMTREQSYSTTGTNVKEQLTFYDQSLTQLSSSALDLYNQIGEIVATGEARGFSTNLDAAFSSLKQTMNTNEGGQYLYGGGNNSSPPFTATAVDDLSTLPAVTDAFQDAGLKVQARVSDQTDMVYGIGAKDAGLDVANILKRLNDMGPIDGKLTDAQMTTLGGIYGDLKTAMDKVTDVQAGNGTRLQQIDVYINGATTRHDQLQSFVSDQEDVDVATVATQLSNDQLALQASYQAFSQVQGMSLVNYLK